MTVTLGAVIGTVFAVLRPADYEATSSVVVFGQSDARTRSPGELANYIQGMMQTFSNVASERIVLEGVAQQLDDGSSWEDLRRQITAEVPMNSTMISLTISDPDPQRAARIANLVPRRLQEVIPELSTDAVRVTVSSTASEPKARNWTANLSGTALGAALGGVLALGVAYLRRPDDLKTGVLRTSEAATKSD